MTQGFDIRDLMQFRPPEYLCERCAAILTSKVLAEEWEKRGIGSCPVCGWLYICPAKSTSQFLQQFREWLKNHHNQAIPQSYLLDSEGVMERAARFAGILRFAEEHQQGPMRALLLAVSEAKHFVHFVSWGISHEMIGILKLAAQQLAVRGFVSGLNRQSKWDRNRSRR